MTEHPFPDSAVRPLREDEVIALHDLADNGGLLCDCDSRPELCHCSTIMMLCDEWRAMRASVKPDVAKTAKDYEQKLEWQAQKIAELDDECQRTEREIEHLLNVLAHTKRLFDERDDFIVSKGLWSEFVDSLPRVPKVRTSHHRNAEEAIRLQALVDVKYNKGSE